MAFRFKKASCVVLGSFNIHIVQPAWLSKIGLVPKGIEIAIGSKLDEPGFRFFSPKLASRWFVTPSRIEVETKSPEEDCGALVASVLEKLPWTPLTAIGNNAIYTAELRELEHFVDLKCFQPSIPEGFEQVQRSFHVGVGREQQVFNLQLSITKELIELSANVHTELRERESDMGQRAARSFLPNRIEAESLIQSLFAARIEHGHGDEQLA